MNKKNSFNRVFGLAIVRFIIIGIIIIFLLVGLIKFIIGTAATKVDSEQGKYEPKIGKRIIIDEDTLTIIDYSSIMETFTLSNGQVVNSNLVFNSNNLLDE